MLSFIIVYSWARLFTLFITFPVGFDETEMSFSFADYQKQNSHSVLNNHQCYCNHKTPVQASDFDQNSDRFSGGHNCQNVSRATTPVPVDVRIPAANQKQNSIDSQNQVEQNRPPKLYRQNTYQSISIGYSHRYKYGCGVSSENKVDGKLCRGRTGGGGVCENFICNLLCILT